MALGALIGAYQEDDAGALRALLPLAGRTLLEYQARCAAAGCRTIGLKVVDRRLELPPFYRRLGWRASSVGAGVTFVVSGFLAHWIMGLPLKVAMLFGAIVSVRRSGRR